MPNELTTTGPGVEVALSLAKALGGVLIIAQFVIVPCRTQVAAQPRGVTCTFIRRRHATQ